MNSSQSWDVKPGYPHYSIEPSRPHHVSLLVADVVLFASLPLAQAEQQIQVQVAVQQQQLSAFTCGLQTLIVFCECQEF